MINSDKIKKDWQSRGFSFGVWEDSPGQVWRDFTHETDELFMLVEGDMTLVLDGKTITPKAGEEIFIPAGATHTVSTSDASSSRWFYGYRR